MNTFTEALEKLRHEFADRWRGIGTDEPEDTGVITQEDFDSFLSRAAQLGAEHVARKVEEQPAKKPCFDCDHHLCIGFRLSIKAARQGLSEVKGE